MVKDNFIKLKTLIINNKKLSIISISIFLVICIAGINYINISIKRAKQVEYNIKNIEERDKELKKIKSEIDDTNDQIKDLGNSMKLVVIKIEQTNYKSEYHDINVTIKNISNSDINYVKVNLYFKDDSGNVVQSESIIENELIKANATQTLSKMIKNNEKYKDVTAEVVKVQ